jgi:hypothetical protein
MFTISRMPAALARLASIAATLALVAAAAWGLPNPNEQAQPRVVAIADVHGDAASFTAILQRAGLINEAGRWTGGSTVLVQEGDLLDRRPDAKQVLTLAMTLESEAPRTGGRAIFLIGNHEAMNAMGELRDVVPATYAAFVDAESESKRQAAWSIHRTLAERRRKAFSDADRSLAVPDVFGDVTEQAWMVAHPPGMLEYLEAFGPSGVYGRWIRGHDAIVRVGASVFQHAGLDPAKAPSKLDDVNSRVRDDLKRWDDARAYLVSHGLAAASFTFGEILAAGQTELARLAAVRRKGGGDSEPVAPVLDAISGIDRSSLVESGGPLWFRGFATWTDEEGPGRMSQLLSRYKVDRFVTGHSPIKSGRITPRFDGRVILIDTGMSSFFRPLGGKPSALEIKDGRLTAIYLDSQSVLSGPQN